MFQIASSSILQLLCFDFIFHPTARLPLSPPNTDPPVQPDRMMSRGRRHHISRVNGHQMSQHVNCIQRACAHQHVTSTCQTPEHARLRNLLRRQMADDWRLLPTRALPQQILFFQPLWRGSGRTDWLSNGARPETLLACDQSAREIYFQHVLVGAWRTSTV